MQRSSQIHMKEGNSLIKERQQNMSRREIHGQVALLE